MVQATTVADCNTHTHTHTEAKTTCKQKKDINNLLVDMIDDQENWSVLMAYHLVKSYFMPKG